VIERSEPLARLERAVRDAAIATAGRAPVGVSHDSADEDVGSFGSDDAIGFDPFPVLDALSRHGARAVVMGQVAGIMHGSVEPTGDFDLLWDGSAEQAPRMTAAFASVGAALTDADGRSIALGVGAFELAKVLFRTATASGDCCTPKLPWGELDIDAILRRADTAVRDGLTVHYVGLPDLIAMRRAVGRAKDRRRNEEFG
jgi:hypothetical protein